MSLNRIVLALDDTHPAKRFLVAFAQCRSDCVGLEIDPENPVDQEWRSLTDDKVWSFSSFAYGFLSTDIDLDEFHQSAFDAAKGIDWPWDLNRLRALMHECADAACKDGNDDIVELTNQVLEMLELWQKYLDYRKETVSHTRT